MFKTMPHCLSCMCRAAATRRDLASFAVPLGNSVKNKEHQAEEGGGHLETSCTVARKQIQKDRVSKGWGEPRPFLVINTEGVPGYATVS